MQRFSVCVREHWGNMADGRAPMQEGNMADSPEPMQEEIGKTKAAEKVDARYTWMMETR